MSFCVPQIKTKSHVAFPRLKKIINHGLSLYNFNLSLGTVYLVGSFLCSRCEKVNLCLPVNLNCKKVNI